MTWVLIVITTVGHIYAIQMDSRLECSNRMEEGMGLVEEQTSEKAMVAACGENHNA